MSTPEPRPGRSILVADDDAVIARYVRAVLEPLGYAVRVAADGAECLQQFVAERPDCVICDLYMPNKDGLEVIGELRRYDARIPVIAMSGGSAVYDADLLPVARHLGASAALRKPFTPRDLETCLDSVFPAPPSA